MKKIIILSMVFILLLTVVPVSSATASTDLRFEINGELYATPEGEPPPYINTEDRTMVPVRFFANALNVPNSQIAWDQATQTASVQKDAQTVSITLGTRYVTVNDVQVGMDTEAEMKDGRVFIPARFIAEGLGAEVGWDQATKTVILTDAEEPEEIDFEIPGDEVFNDPNLSDKASTDRFDYVDGKLLFRFPGDDYEEAYEGYEVQEVLNPQINVQALNATKVLLDDNHYVSTVYVGSEEYPRVLIKYAVNYLSAYRDNTFFNYIFYEQTPFDMETSWQHEDFSDAAVISLKINTLRTGPNEPPNNPFYEKKIHDSLLSIFGEQTGTEIFNYVIEKYLDERNPSEKEVKHFDGVQVDFAHYSGYPLSFFFTLPRDEQV